NNVAQAAWALLLSRYARSRDVVFGVLRSCRRSEPPALADAIGGFCNVLPLRVALDDDANVFDLLRQVRDTHRQLREHECDDPAGILRAAALTGADRLYDTVLEFDLRDPAAAL